MQLSIKQKLLIKEFIVTPSVELIKKHILTKDQRRSKTCREEVLKEIRKVLDANNDFLK